MSLQERLLRLESSSARLCLNVRLNQLKKQRKGKKIKMLIEHALALTLAYVLDLLIDPPHWPHPVRWIGNGIACLEKHLNKGRVRKLKGTMMVITIIAIVFVATSLIIWACRSIHPFLGIVAEGIIIFTTIARRNLQEHALDVYGPLREGNLPEAQECLPALSAVIRSNLMKEKLSRNGGNRCGKYK